MSERYRILIADASPTVRRVLRAELDTERFEVIETGNGNEALAIVESHRPEIATVSAVLPGRNGLEVCKQIASAKTTHPTKVIMVTSNDTVEDRRAAFEAGAVRFLAKGFPKGELANYVEAIIQTQNQLKNAKILVADDNKFIRFSVTQLLESEGAIVYQANDGIEAMELIRKHEIDVVLTDYHMPKLDGISFLSNIRGIRDYEATPVLMLSGSGNKTSKLRALDAGANDFICKPFEGIELLARLRSFVRLSELTRELKAEARHDALTGVFSRREILRRLDELCAESARYKTPFSCIMLDIDHFKSFNDTHGHAAGDAVLQLVAKTIDNCLRRTDYLGRLGGEEFVVLCSNTSQDAGMICAEKIRNAVAAASITFEDKKLNATISLGVAEFGELLNDADFLVNAADRALYEAKRTGRNRVCAFQVEERESHVEIPVAVA